VGVTKTQVEMYKDNSLESEEEEKEQVVHRNPIRELGFAQIEHVIGLDKGLSDGAYRTLSILHFFWRQTHKAWPSLETLCKLRGKKHTAISAHLAELQAKRIITRERRYSRSTITWLEDLPDEYYRAAENFLNQRDIRKNGRPSSEKADGLRINKEKEPRVTATLSTASGDSVPQGRKPGPQEAAHRMKSEARVEFGTQDATIAPRGGDKTTAQQKMVAALVEVTDSDEQLNSRMLTTSASKLVKAGYTSEQILKYYGGSNSRAKSWWYRNDWRGQKGQRPTIRAINETIRAARNHDSKEHAVAVNQNGDGSFNL
jgi:hypothetical protein